jgi:hypothetical protein
VWGCNGMKLKDRIDELEKRVKELEQRPIVYPPVYVPAPYVPAPANIPLPYIPPWQSPFTCGRTTAMGPFFFNT